MATKSKVNFHSIGYKLLGVIIILIGVFSMSFVVMNLEETGFFILGERMIRTSDRYTDSDEVREIVASLIYKNGGIAGFKSVENSSEDIKKLNEYEKKGYQYYIAINGDIVERSSNAVKVYQILDDVYHGINYSNYEGIRTDSIEISDLSDGWADIVVTTPQAVTKEIMRDNSYKIVKGQQVFYISLCGFVLFCFGVIFTAVLSGRKISGGAVEFRFYDKIYNDILIVFYLFATITVTTLIIMGWYEVSLNFLSFPIEVLKVLTVFSVVFVSAITFWTTSTISKRVKTSTFWKHTAIYKTCAFIFKSPQKFYELIQKLFKAITAPFEKMANKTLRNKIIFGSCVACIVLWINTFILMTMREYSAFASLWFLVSIPVMIWFCVRFLQRPLEQLEEIKKGATIIKDGNLNYKIPRLEIDDLNEVAQSINNISVGLHNAVQAATVSEKMKTELVTNVSHDLKTPLTSIISYVDLLAKEENISDEARDYIAVLKTKSERLKNIISDLFDLSKSASGNVDIVFEEIDFKKLVEQTLADMGDRIEQSGHIIKQNLPEHEIIINADGRKMYRVMQNIIDNALKYSLKGTRIFVNLTVENYIAKLQIVNTASYEMDFSEREVLERFSRGDKARTSEGSGLGLSIAQTFTDLCKGKFDVKIDGDQFKVSVEFFSLN